MTKRTLYQQAVDRVEQSPELQAYGRVLLYDWPEGAEHYRWVVDAPVAELVGWAQATDICARCGQHINRAELDPPADGDLCVECERAEVVA